MISSKTKALFTKDRIDYFKKYFETLGDSFPGYIPSADVEQMCASQGLTVDELMITLLYLPQEYAITPISGYNVGALLNTSSGNIYYGANMEYLDVALSFTVHAEQSSVANAIAHNETKAISLAVSAAPCGYCRQFLYELNNAAKLDVVLDGKATQLLTYYLPDPFGPGDLGVTGGLMDAQDHNLQLVYPTTDDVVNFALAQSNKAYSPYTACYAGVAIQTANGNIYGGTYAENAAYNPSMSPLEAALVDMVMSGGNEPTRIVLVEPIGLKNSQLGATQAVAGSVASSVTVEYYQTT